MNELKNYSLVDSHLQALMVEFEEAVRDLKGDPSPGRIKTCFQKQFNFFEALGQRCPGVTAKTLGDICNQINSWPHPAIREALKKLYGFRSDYPGLGHAGSPAAVLREIDLRDFVAVGVLLAGFAPYLAHNLNPELVYHR